MLHQSLFKVQHLHVFDLVLVEEEKDDWHNENAQVIVEHVDQKVADEARKTLLWANISEALDWLEV